MKLSVHPLFFVFACIAVFSGVGIFAAFLLIAVLVHEYSHLAVAKFFGIRTTCLTILPFGASVDIKASFLPPRQQILILLAGSFGNIFFALLCGGLLWLFPNLFITWELLILANVVPAILNLLPIYPLDGGKILLIMFGNRATLIIKWLSASIFTVLMIAAVLVLNVQLFLLGAMMLVMIFLEIPSSSFTTNFSQFKNKTIVEMVVHEKMTLLDVYKLTNPKHYTKFVFASGKSFTEFQLEQWLMECETTTQLDSDCLKTPPKITEIKPAAIGT